MTMCAHVQGALRIAGRTHPRWASKKAPVVLDNLAKRSIRKALEKAKIEWLEWSALRRFLGTQVRMQADTETASKALGNSKEVADKHYIKPTEVLPDVRRAVKSAVSGLIS